MAITDNAVISYESGQSLQPFEELTDSGDQKNFTSSFAPWSGRSGFEAAVRPYGLVTGGAVSIPASGSDDVVDVAALTAYMAGESGADADGLVTVAADTDVAINRATVGPYVINSITVDNTGAIAVVGGTEGTGFVETRGAVGGPPYIPVDSIEIAQVRLSTTAAAPVVASEIFQVVGAHTERSDFPVWTENEADGEVDFVAALPTIHTGDVPKKVYVKGNTPIFAEIPRTSDWVPSETTHTVNSTQVYDGTIGSVTSNIGQASFTARLKDGITDAIMGQKNERVWVKFQQDRNKAPYQLTLGKLGVSTQYPVGDHVLANFTVSAEDPTVGFSS